MTNDLSINMKIISSDNINMKLEDSKPIDANIGGGIVEIDPIFTNSPAYKITNADITYWNNKSNFSGSYTDLTNKPTIPTKTSQLNNDSGFIDKNVNNLSNYTLSTNISEVGLTGKYSDLIDAPTIPSKTSDLSNDSGYITNTVNDLTNYTLSSSLASVATTGSYTDLINKPTLATVATSGFYSDLINKPTIPSKTSQLTNDSGFITNANIPTKTSDLSNDSGFITNTVNDLTNYTLSSSLATVATTGSYTDLSNTPTIPVVPTNVSSFNNDAGYITNTVNNLTNYTLSSSLATVATTGSYTDLSNTPTIPVVPTDVSSFNNDAGYITNTVNDLTNYTLSSSLATVATSGSYTDLIDKPTLATFNIYSTTETVIGTFLGKPLYRKVFETTTPSTTPGNVATITNLGKMVNLYGFIINGSQQIPMNYSYASNEITSLYVSGTSIQFNTNYANYKGKDCYFIAEYTKSTD